MEKYGKRSISRSMFIWMNSESVFLVLQKWYIYFRVISMLLRNEYNSVTSWLSFKSSKKYYPFTANLITTDIMVHPALTLREKEKLINLDSNRLDSADLRFKNIENEIQNCAYEQTSQSKVLYSTLFLFFLFLLTNIACSLRFGS